ncbi:hypothetical protein I8748_14345 [Nostoc sp. CENA67]|uniref:PEP-CTERM protein-sorting domain-containing protein n=1 Tax=Amazonocrinis nigriterrae CENA67 TaxID=2794033 RepID=A0A8J7HPU2_9NOST|nr:hypothetical protein [Amazonocrinis nigriterrae]MBH8563352.1 hypothetical protein [Amazonocrinis nigriterrae CENA67]
MNPFKVCTLTVLLSAFTFAQSTRASAITAPPLETQVKEVAQWFTGLFDNSQQVLTNSSVIKFRRVYPIPEPSFTLGMLALGIWGTSKIILGKQKYKRERGTRGPHDRS